MQAIEDTTISTLRGLSIDAIQAANSGHPGLPLGCAPMAYALWHDHLRLDPSTPLWLDRDRFVLSAGHGSALLYALLHLTGFDLPLEELKRFRQWNSKTPGHPEWHWTPGVEATTGPLGQGAANAVGMALAEVLLGRLLNRPGHVIIDHHTYALVSDGDVMEGVAMEAVSLAGHLRLGKLTYLYDANDVTLDGPLDLIMSEDVGARFAAAGWHVQTVADGDRDVPALNAAVTAAKADPRPSLIIVRTTIGFGSPKKAGTSAAHGSPLGTDEVAATKRALGMNPDLTFDVPAGVREHMGEIGRRGKAARLAWEQRVAAARAAHPDVGTLLDDILAGRLPKGWDTALPTWQVGDKLATRVASGKVLTALAQAVPFLVGGDADLGGSTKTIVPGGDLGPDGVGRNIRFGIREHAMGAMCNGMVYHGGLRPFASTFFVFSDYMRPAVRLAALNKQPVIYVWTHDSIGVGEDGPTHQPIEHLMSLRAMPGLAVFRPADANETVAAWRFAMTRADGPTALVLSRQDLPVLGDAKSTIDGALRGAYIVRGEGACDAILIATGSEVALAVAAAEACAASGARVRVVSMPCWELFRAQDAAYRESVLPSAQPARVSVEAGVTFGWHEWLGPHGVAIGVDRYGASAPGEVLYAQLGLTRDAVVNAIAVARTRST